MPLTISTYLDDGRVFQYEVADEGKAREHCAAIVATGYRHNSGEGVFEWYPPHRITKVKATGASIATKYPDTTTGT